LQRYARALGFRLELKLVRVRGPRHSRGAETG
jgi:hypothetical protein